MLDLMTPVDKVLRPRQTVQAVSNCQNGPLRWTASIVELLQSAFVGLHEHPAVSHVCQQGFWLGRRQSDGDSTCAVTKYSGPVLLLSPSVCRFQEGHQWCWLCGNGSAGDKW